jgi:DNA gyrase inhibitor GyrI
VTHPGSHSSIHLFTSFLSLPSAPSSDHLLTAPHPLRLLPYIPLLTLIAMSAVDAPSASSSTPPYHLDVSGDVVTWTPLHYIYTEQAGPIPSSAATCWSTFTAVQQSIFQHNTVIKHASMYRIDEHGPDFPSGVYRVGVMVEHEPVQVPTGLKSCRYEGGKYARFVMTGSYKHLPAASGQVYTVVKERQVEWNEKEFTLECYINDPRSTPPQELKTEILVPLR